MKKTLYFIMITTLLVSTFGIGTNRGDWFTSNASAAGERLYWGGYLDGEPYGLGDAPWEPRTIDTFEQHAGKKVSIIHWGQFWHWGSQSGYSGIGDGFFQKFDTRLYEAVRQRGAIPMINWNSWSGSAGGSSNQPDYQLIDIINGKYDAYIRQWARDAKSWGKPFFLRFDHEMNGNWYPWSEVTNGNQRGQYVQMWRHVHDLFELEGATNVTWVWSVNTEYASSAYSSELESLYPGDAYVDWVAIDGYNWGTNPAKPDTWKSFSQVMKGTYDHLVRLAPGKPIMLSEFGSTEYGGSKANWITDALTTQIPANFPAIKAVVWFNYNAYEGSGQMDWIIESSSSAQSAFAKGISSATYATNEFATTTDAPIKPLSPLASNPTPTASTTAPTAAPTATPTTAPRIAPGSNLIQNPSFESTGSAWLSPWDLVVSSGAAGSIAQDGATRADGSYSAKLSVTTSASSAPWGVQLSNRNLVLNAGEVMSGSFWAKASTTREIQVVVQMGASPYTEYYRASVTVETSWQQYMFTYTQPASLSNAMLAINVAQTTGQVWLDNVTLSGPSSVPTATAVPTTAPTASPISAPTTAPTLAPTSTPGTNLVLNPSYEATGATWLDPWYLVTSSGATGSVAQDSTTDADGFYSARINVTSSSPSAPWGVQLSQGNLALNTGEVISGSFWAKASSTRDLQVVVQLSVSPYTEYYRGTFTLGPSWKEYTFSFTQPVALTNAKLAFNAAQATGQLWLDQVSVSRPDSAASPTPAPTASATPAPTSTPSTSTDTQAPWIKISNPGDGSRLPKNKTITLTAQASDNTGVAKVVFTITSASGYNWTCTVTRSPYSCAWTVPNSAYTTYTVKAVAYDTANNTASYTITVKTK